MHRLARFLSILAVVAAVLTISITYFRFPQMDFEIAVFFSAVTVFLSLAAGGLALLLAAILAVNKDSPKPVITTVLSIIALVLACGWIWLSY